MDFIRPIGPVDREVDPIRRVDRAHDEPREEQQQKKEPDDAGGKPPEELPEATPEGPVEGDDGHLHIDVRA
jgi:hypothetical protein